MQVETENTATDSYQEYYLNKYGASFEEVEKNMWHILEVRQDFNKGGNHGHFPGMPDM